jgi:hypothetical protein
MLENSKLISQAKYHEDFEKNIKNKFTSLADCPETTRAIENQKLYYRDLWEVAPRR